MINQNISLRPYNTFGIEATAQYFASATSPEVLRELLKEPYKKVLLGGGSNVLLTKNIEGLVIQMGIKGIEIIREEGTDAYVRAGGGERWHGLVEWSIENGLGGLENLSLIPGTVGASPIQNIGAYGAEIKDVFVELEAMHLASGELRTFSRDECKFHYRDSIFKNELLGQYAICSVTFRLSRAPRFNLKYGDLQRSLELMGVEKPTLRAVSDAVIEIRRSKLPDPAELGNAGSFFKNPEITQDHYNRLVSKYHTLPGHPTAAGIKVPAGWLIECAGWKGRNMGNAGCHARQALVLVNRGQATGQEVLALAKAIMADVDRMFGIKLMPEVNVW